jgi:hypothetical protein
MCAKMVPKTCSHCIPCEGILSSKQITVLEHPPYSLDVPEDKGNIEM